MIEREIDDAYYEILEPVLVSFKGSLKERFPTFEIQLFRKKHQLIIRKKIGEMNYHVTIGATNGYWYWEQGNTFPVFIELQEPTTHVRNEDGQRITHGGKRTRWELGIPGLDRVVHDPNKFALKINTAFKLLFRFLDGARTTEGFINIPNGLDIPQWGARWNQDGPPWIVRQ